MKYVCLLILALGIAPVSAQVSISANQSIYGWQVLPGDTIRIYANITGGTTNQVNWSYASTGGATATLDATTNANPWVDVTVGSTAGTCSISPASNSGSVTYTVSSTAVITVTAQSVDDNTKSATFPIDVCQPSTQVFILPAYVVLYSGQPVDLQSWVFGNHNQSVTWSIGQPAGGNGTLSDSSYRDTVFTATVSGDYTLTATSVADNTKSATVTVHVTANPFPSYTMTPEETEPVDCTSTSGNTYEVGPSQAYTSINTALNAIYNISTTDWHNTTVRVHNEDTTGSNPTTYHEYIQIKAGGTSTQPFRICGVPDSHGNLPVIDGNNSTGLPWESVGAAVGYGIVNIWPGPPTPYGSFSSMNPLASTAGAINIQNVLVEGLHIKDASGSFSYIPASTLLSGTYQSGGTITGTSGQTCTITFSVYPSSDNAVATVSLTGTNTIAAGTALTVTQPGNGQYPAPTSGALSNGTATCSGTATVTTTIGSGSAVAWGNGSECINARDGIYEVFRGDDIEKCDDGTFSEFNANNSGFAAFGGLQDWEGNHIHDNAYNSSVQGIHQLYLQGWLQLVQFNVIDQMAYGGQGDNFKDRGVGTVFRYNYLADGLGTPPNSPARTVDIVDQQDASNYMDMDDYIPNGWASGDTMGPNLLTAWRDLFGLYDMYGNIMQNSTALSLVHYAGDHGVAYGAERRKFLHFYNNTVNITGSSATTFFDLNDNGGGQPYEYPQILVENNVLWETGSIYACWNSTNTHVGSFVTNVTPTGTLDQISLPISSSAACNLSSGWTSQTGSLTAFTAVTPINNHIDGISSSNFIATGTQPFTSNYSPVNAQNGTALTGDIAALPVRFEFIPSNNKYYYPRVTTVTSSNGGIIGAVDTTALTGNSSPLLLLGIN